MSEAVQSRLEFKVCKRRVVCGGYGGKVEVKGSGFEGQMDGVGMEDDLKEGGGLEWVGSGGMKLRIKEEFVDDECIKKMPKIDGEVDGKRVNFKKENESLVGAEIRQTDELLVSGERKRNGDLRGSGKLNLCGGFVEDVVKKNESIRINHLFDATTTTTPATATSTPATTTQTTPAKRKARWKDCTEEEVLCRQLPHILSQHLDIIIVGFNPGLAAAYIGHHYAGPGNHFWKCLHMSGLTDVLLKAQQDTLLMTQYHIGLTNIVSRTSRGSSDLSRQELREGWEWLLKVLHHYQPLIVAFNGKGIFEVVQGNKNFPLGRQEHKIANAEVFVMPSSSARCSQLPRAVDKVPYYIALKRLRDRVKGDAGVKDEEVVFHDVKLSVKKKDKNDEEKVKKEKAIVKEEKKSKKEKMIESKNNNKKNKAVINGSNMYNGENMNIGKGDLNGFMWSGLKPKLEEDYSTSPYFFHHQPTNHQPPHHQLPNHQPHYHQPPHHHQPPSHQPPHQPHFHQPPSHQPHYHQTHHHEPHTFSPYFTSFLPTPSLLSQISPQLSPLKLPPPQQPPQQPSQQPPKQPSQQPSQQPAQQPQQPPQQPQQQPSQQPPQQPPQQQPQQQPQQPPQQQPQQPPTTRISNNV